MQKRKFDILFEDILSQYQDNNPEITKLKLENLDKFELRDRLLDKALDALSNKNVDWSEGESYDNYEEDYLKDKDTFFELYITTDTDDKYTIIVKYLSSIEIAIEGWIEGDLIIKKFVNFYDIPEYLDSSLKYFSNVIIDVSIRCENELNEK